MHLGFFSLAVRKCIEDDHVSGVGITLDHSLRIQSLMVEESRLQELEAAGRMAPANRRLGAMSTAAAAATATAELLSLPTSPRIPDREWRLLQQVRLILYQVMSSRQRLTGGLGGPVSSGGS